MTRLRAEDRNIEFDDFQLRDRREHLLEGTAAAFAGAAD
jgi:hypothetical protein